MKDTEFTPDFFNKFGNSYLPGHLGIQISDMSESKVSAYFQVKKSLMAPNGYLHAGSVVALADTCCGYGCFANLPKGATSFTTIELKSNHLGTVREGIVKCDATAIHLGKTTQVWDAKVFDEKSRKTIALFRCTQMLLYQNS